MGAPKGHPYAHPEGVCINGLGALPSPYGPTLRGAHNGPSGLQKKKIIRAWVQVCACAYGCDEGTESQFRPKLLVNPM